MEYRGGGFLDGRGFTDTHKHRSAEYLFLFMHGVLKGTSIGGLHIKPQRC